MKLMNAAFRKPVLTDRDEGKRFTSAPRASHAPLGKDRWRKGNKNKTKKSAPPFHPLSSSRRKCVKKTNHPISCEREFVITLVFKTGLDG